MSRLDLLSVDAPAIRRLEEMTEQEEEEEERGGGRPGPGGGGGGGAPLPRRRSIDDFFEDADMEDPLLTLMRQQ